MEVKLIKRIFVPEDKPQQQKAAPPPPPKRDKEGRQFIGSGEDANVFHELAEV